MKYVGSQDRLEVSCRVADCRTSLRRVRDPLVRFDDLMRVAVCVPKVGGRWGLIHPYSSIPVFKSGS
jgi:hypothetical protein